MATKVKKVSDTRPTLEEVKAQPGQYLFVTYEGTQFGMMGIPALRQRWVGDVQADLEIELFNPKMIDVEWLDNPIFREHYLKHTGIKVWKSDTLPKPPDYTLPDDLERTISEARKQFARTLATSDYDEKFKDIVQMTARDLPETEAMKWENQQLYPFLEVLRIYEERLLNRKEILRDIDKRLKEIESRVDGANRRSRYKAYQR